MSKIITIYHGSEKIIKNPVYAEKGCSLAIFMFICI